MANKYKYMAVLFAPDGDWVTDYRGCNSKEEVQEYLANQGSKWFFYPFGMVIVDNNKAYMTNTQRIVDAPDEFEHLVGKTINEVTDWMLEHPQYVEGLLGA